MEQPAGSQNDHWQTLPLVNAFERSGSGGKYLFFFLAGALLGFDQVHRRTGFF
jgi:hypothetical protein